MCGLYGWTVERETGMFRGECGSERVQRVALRVLASAFVQRAVLDPCGLTRMAFRPRELVEAQWRERARADGGGVAQGTAVGAARGGDAAAERSLAPADSIAPAGWSVVRERVLQGEVHDENAWILGGVCGHTGLFADVEEVLRLGEALLDGGVLGDARRHLFEDLTGGLSPARSAAFVRDDPQFGAPGCATWSHTGYTGTSLCLLPDREAAIALLTNRVHPARGNERIVEARAALHPAAWALLKTPIPRTP